MIGPAGGASKKSCPDSPFCSVPNLEQFTRTCTPHAPCSVQTPAGRGTRSSRKVNVAVSQRGTRGIRGEQGEQFPAQLKAVGFIRPWIRLSRAGFTLHSYNKLGEHAGIEVGRSVQAHCRTFLLNLPDHTSPAASPCYLYYTLLMLGSNTNRYETVMCLLAQSKRVSFIPCPAKMVQYSQNETCTSCFYTFGLFMFVAALAGLWEGSGQPEWGRPCWVQLGWTVPLHKQGQKLEPPHLPYLAPALAICIRLG
ncbi:hypothetical protein AOLI_G00230440 [Acnodon oligacanthus]